MQKKLIESEPKHKIVENGKALSIIIVSENESELASAKELQYYLKKITSVEIPIHHNTDVTDRYLIVIGSMNHEFSLDFPDLTRESYVIRTIDNRLHLFGADNDGLYFSVVTFLEKFCEVRWFWPGELGEIVPEKNSILIPDIDMVETPDFKWRERGPGGPLWGHFDRISKQRDLGITEEHQAEVQKWERRNKLGGMKICGGHDQGQIVSPHKYGKEHPEYFALIDGRRDRDFADFDGKHGAQLCTSNPDLLPVFENYFVQFFEDHPNYDGLHVTPNDGGKFCQCEKCQALDTGKPWRKNPEKPAITDRIFTFVNTLAERLQRKYPGKYLACMAYSWYVDPPDKIRISDYVIPQYCLWSCYLHWNDTRKDEHYTVAKGWTEVAKNVGIYEYFINGAWPDLPRIVYPKIAESLSYLHSIGIKLYQAQAGDGFAINGLNYYIASKLWWDIDADVDGLIKDFYEKAFGTAGIHVMKYHDRLMAAWKDAVANGMHPACSSFAVSQVHEVYPLELLDECEKDLNQALESVSDKTIKRRIEFLQKGLIYTILTIDAVTNTKMLENCGITISAQTFTDEEELIDLDGKEKSILEQGEDINLLIENSLKAWQKRDRYVESLKDDFVISYFWIRYNDTNRVFNPTKRLLELKNKIELLND
jgi:hypothetical protein